jgi:hypothetical protein
MRKIKQKQYEASKHTQVSHGKDVHGDVECITLNDTAQQADKADLTDKANDHGTEDDSCLYNRSNFKRRKISPAFDIALQKVCQAHEENVLPTPLVLSPVAMFGMLCNMHQQQFPGILQDEQIVQMQKHVHEQSIKHLPTKP